MVFNYIINKEQIKFINIINNNNSITVFFKQKKLIKIVSFIF
jgi:hypothetical protein